MINKKSIENVYDDLGTHLCMHFLFVCALFCKQREGDFCGTKERWEEAFIPEIGFVVKSTAYSTP